jgi:predicted lactoylglutathione lyase
MYGSNVADPDSDVREVLWTDEAAAQSALQERWG